MKMVKVITLFLGLNFILLSTAFSQDMNEAEYLQNNPDALRMSVIYQDLNGSFDFQKFTFSPNEQFIVAIQNDAETAIVIDVIQEAQVTEVSHGAEISDVAFSSNSSLLITAGADGSIKSWDTTTFELQTSIETTSRIGFVETWMDQLVFYGNDGNKVLLWDSYLGDILLELTLSNKPIDMTFDLNRDLQAILDITGQIHIFDARDYTGETLYTIESAYDEGIPLQVTFSKNADAIFVSYDNGDVVAYNIETNSEPYHISGLNYSSLILNNYVQILPIQESEDTINFFTLPLDSFSNPISLFETSIPFNTVLSESNDYSISVLGIVPEPDWETEGVGAPAAFAINVYTGEEIYFWGRTQHVQFSPSGQYILSVTIDNSILLFEFT